MDGNEAEWDVGVVWLSRHLHRPDRMLRTRYRAARQRGDRESLEAAGDSGDLSGCAGDLGDEFGLVLVAIFLAVALVALGPGLLAITVGLVEIALLVIGAVIVSLFRVAFGRPWEVLARSSERTVAWRAQGVREARQLAREVDDGLAAGHDPATIRLGELDEDIPAAVLDAPGMYSRTEFRRLGQMLGLAIGGALVFGALLLVVKLN